MPLIASLDMRVLAALYTLRDPLAVQAGIAISELGTWYTTLGIAAVVALSLALKYRFALAQGILLTAATSGIGVFFLKGLVARPRPPEQFWAYHETWYSFPSGHAAMSLAVYGFVAYIVWKTGGTRLARIVWPLCMTALVLIIGFLRLYLGVHYLSDVIGGYVLGALCLSLGIWSERTLSRDTMQNI
jgi:undecaprenyl-diphosphatase